MAQFKKGNGGRPKGAVNKTSKNLSDFIGDLITDNMEQIQLDLKKLKPAQRLLFIEKLLKYKVPTLSSTTLEELEKSKAKEKKQVWIIGEQRIEF